MSKDPTGSFRSDSNPVSYLRPMTLDEISALRTLDLLLEAREMCGIGLLLPDKTAVIKINLGREGSTSPVSYSPSGREAPPGQELKQQPLRRATDWFVLSSL